MSKILKKLASWFEMKQFSQLEQFINSKNPTNATEVEYWTREYESNNTTYWGRGL